jgi:hypothetical protein
MLLKRHHQVLVQIIIVLNKYSYRNKIIILMIIVNLNYLLVNSHLKNVFMKMIKFIIGNKNNSVEDNKNNNKEDKDNKEDNVKDHIKNNKKNKKVINLKYGIKYSPKISRSKNH